MATFMRLAGTVGELLEEIAETAKFRHEQLSGSQSNNTVLREQLSAVATWLVYAENYLNDEKERWEIERTVEHAFRNRSVAEVARRPFEPTPDFGGDGIF
jgi:hypothetical protein